MVQLLNPRVLVASLVLFVAASGCAHRKPASPAMVYLPAPPPPPPPPPPPKKLKLVVLPLDKLALPGTAEELNTKLAQVKLAGVEDATLATVSMETAQLQSECADPTETCYLKIARLVDADRLLWAQVEKVAAKGRKRGKKNHTRIQIILFDRDKLAVSGQADETFAGSVSGDNLDKLILAATGVRPGAAAPAPAVAPPAAAPPPAVAPAMAPPAARPAAAAPLPAARPAYAPQPAAAPQPVSRQPVAPAPAQAGYPPPATARPPAAYSPPAAAPPPAAYPPPAATPPPAAYPPPAAAPPPAAYPPPAAAPPPAAYPPPAAAAPSYAPPAAAPPPASGPAPARWQ